MPILRPVKWLRRSIVIALVIVALLVVAVNLRLFVWPPTDTIEPADAVVVLAGDDGARLERGLELVHDGVAPNLALSFGPDRICGAPQEFEVVCFTPSPPSTRGEAEALGRLAQEHGWSDVVLVTSTPHLTRARLLVERCFSGTLQVAGVTPRESLRGWVDAIVHEWGGLAEALVRRDC